MVVLGFNVVDVGKRGCRAPRDWGAFQRTGDDCLVAVGKRRPDVALLRCYGKGPAPLKHQSSTVQRWADWAANARICTTTFGLRATIFRLRSMYIQMIPDSVLLRIVNARFFCYTMHQCSSSAAAWPDNNLHPRLSLWDGSLVLYGDLPCQRHWTHLQQFWGLSLTLPPKTLAGQGQAGLCVCGGHATTVLVPLLISISICISMFSPIAPVPCRGLRIPQDSCS